MCGNTNQNALKCITIVLRYLPSLKIAFPEFRLVQPQDPAVRAILSQQGLSRHAANFETQYLMTLVANANVENM